MVQGKQKTLHPQQQIENLEIWGNDDVDHEAIWGNIGKNSVPLWAIVGDKKNDVSNNILVLIYPANTLKVASP